jgi:hypothetical protein
LLGINVKFGWISILFMATLLVDCHANAEEVTSSTIQSVDLKPFDELWLNAGFYSYHFERNKNLDDNGLGLGIEYRYSSVNSITAGRFHNSDRQISTYAAWLIQPYQWGHIRLGLLIGVINGYPKANNGDWFPLMLPVASFEYKHVGFNFTAVPTYQDVLHGSLSLQLKFKIY